MWRRDGQQELFFVVGFVISLQACPDPLNREFLCEGNSVGRYVCKTRTLNFSDWNNFNPTQAIFKKLKYFLEPSIFIKVWNLAFKSRRWCAGLGSKSHWVFPQEHPHLRGIKAEWTRTASIGALSCQQGMYVKQGMWFFSSDMVKVHLVTDTSNPEGLELLL